MRTLVYAILFLALLPSSCLSAQQEGNIWYFGQEHGVSFASGSPEAITDGALTTFEGCASICDVDGSLLFYTNGGGRISTTSPQGSIWNRNHEVLYDMEGLKGGAFGATQSSIFIPNPANTDQYYLFTMEEREYASDGLPAGQTQGRGLTYFLLDRTLNGGLGGTIIDDERLHVPSYETLSATRHANGTDYWIYIVDDNTGDFFRYRVDAGGITGPVLQPRAVSDSITGPLKISPARNRMFIGGVLYNLNSSNGNVSNPRVLPGTLNSNTYSFSPDGSYLYVIEPTVSGALAVRYDALSANPLPTRTIFATLGPAIQGQMQLAPDGKLYWLSYSPANGQNVSFNAINCPNSPQATLSENVLLFPFESVPFFGLPNFMDYIFNTEETLIADLGPDTLLNCNNGPITLAPQTQGDEFLWSTGDTSPTLTVTSPGIYSLTVSSECGFVADTIEVFQNADTPTASISGPASICRGDTAVLQAATNLSGLWSWSSGDTLPAISAVEPGLYVATITDFCGRTAVDSFELIVIEDPAIELAAPSALCPDETGTATAFSAGALQYAWSNGAVGDSITLTGGGSYGLSITNGCGQLDTLFQIDSLIGPLLLLEGAEPLCPGGEVRLLATTSPEASLRWSDGSTLPELTAKSPGIYVATAENRCAMVADSVDLQPIGCENCFYIPNAFSPNDDGRNDLFLPVNLCPVEGYMLQVYDRWGGLVFEAQAPGLGWDGARKGERMPVGVYNWVLQYVQAGQQFRRTGDLQLLR